MKTVFLFLLSLVLGSLALALLRVPLGYFVPLSSSTELKAFAKYSLLAMMAFLSVAFFYVALSSMASE